MSNQKIITPVPVCKAVAKELTAFNLSEFLNKEIPPQENILTPIIKTQSLSMLFAKRGVGKTHVALGMAYAIASGRSFLKWTAPCARRVLYIDGEMSAVSMQDRLKCIASNHGEEIDPDFFMLLTPDFQDLGMPDISTFEGQKELEPFVEPADFIVVDNISTLARTGKENEAESWLPIQRWALDMRSRGKSVLFVHHAGKGGQQRGSSRREDVLDTVIDLRHPEDYCSDHGARFAVHYSKARHLMGDEVKPFEAHLQDGVWLHSDIVNSTLKQVKELSDQGLSYRQIAERVGISKSAVGRLLQE